MKGVMCFGSTEGWKAPVLLQAHRLQLIGVILRGCIALRTLQFVTFSAENIEADEAVNINYQRGGIAGGHTIISMMSCQGLSSAFRKKSPNASLPLNPSRQK